MKWDKRQSRQFWAVNEEYNIAGVMGYSCAPDNSDYWWVPQLSMSLKFGHYLFDTRKEALTEAIREVMELISSLERRLDKLRVAQEAER